MRRGCGDGACRRMLPPRAALPTHWIMSSSFSTLAKVATLFLSR